MNIITFEQYAERFSKEFNSQNKLSHWILSGGTPTATVVEDIYGGDKGKRVFVNPLAITHLCDDEYMYECLFEDELNGDDLVLLPFETDTLFSDKLDYSKKGVISFNGVSYATHQLKFDDGVLRD